MHFQAIQTTTNPSPPDSVIQQSAESGCCMLLFEGGMGWKCSVEERRNYEPKSSKKSQRNPYSRM